MTKEELIPYLKENLKIEIDFNDHRSRDGLRTIVITKVKVLLDKEIVATDTDSTYID